MDKYSMCAFPGGRGVRLCALFFILLAGISPAALFAQLSLQQAEDRALGQDPMVRALDAEQSSLEELSVAAAQLPDPLLRVGVLSVPVDTFDFGQEPMTQVLAGVVQKFPRGDTRSLEQQQLREKAVALDFSSLDQRLQIRLDVRLNYLDVLLQVRQKDLTESVIRVFDNLVDITRNYYASGLAQQQDVLQATVELERIRDRAAQYEQEERQYRARLGVYLGEAASLPIEKDWPHLPALMGPESIRGHLKNHPRIRKLQQQVTVADTGVDLARQRYRPEFALDVSYGFRSGEDASGVSRPDLFSVMLFMDVPLFHHQRQDRVTAARIATSESVAFLRDDAYRRLQADVEGLYVRLEDVRERTRLYDEVLLPQASFSADASFEAYQSSVGDLVSLLRSRIAEYELGLEFVRLQADALKTEARLLYLQGGA